jgi:polyisoprenoid-binding protein YceI
MIVPFLIGRSLLMRARFFNAALAALVIPILGLAQAAVADDYVLDGAHSGVTFKISHLDLTWVHGRFDSFTGAFTLDPSDATRSSFNLNIKSDSVDTNNVARDTHLRSPDFFNVKQFPTISFKSTAVKPIEGGYDVTGDLTMHGATKPVAFTLKGGRTAEFPRGVMRTGYATELVLKRSEFGVGRPMPVLGDEVHIAISFEATKKR